MIVHPAVVVHGFADAAAALAPGLPVTLLSAPGAAGYAGSLWWRELIAAARAEAPNVPAIDILDCAEAPGMALGALRAGITRLVLWPQTPGWQTVADIAQQQGGFVLAEAPPALDLAEPNVIRRLSTWLAGSAAGDSKARLD